MRPFWLEQALRGEASDAPALQGAVNADVCIVGGGFTGLWTALQLKRANPHLDVVLIEADICGAGASGRNGGCLLTWETRFLTLRRLFGESEALRLVEASRQTVDKITAFCREHRIDAQIRVDGTLYTATSAAQIGSAEAVKAALDERGMGSFVSLDVEEVRRRAGSKRHLAGDFSPVAATVQPALLVRGLRRVALEMGVRLYEKTAFESLSYVPGPLVRTTYGEVRAKRVVLAINAWMAKTFPQFERSIALVSSDMIITERAPEILERLGFRNGLSVLDSRTFVYYYRTTPDGRADARQGRQYVCVWRPRAAGIRSTLAVSGGARARSERVFFLNSRRCRSPQAGTGRQIGRPPDCRSLAGSTNGMTCSTASAIQATASVRAIWAARSCLHSYSVSTMRGRAHRSFVGRAACSRRNRFATWVHWSYATRFAARKARRTPAPNPGSSMSRSAVSRKRRASPTRRDIYQIY